MRASKIILVFSLIFSFFFITQGCKKKVAPPMTLEISSFPDGGAIPAKYAFCAPAEEGHAKLGENYNPHVRWANVPAEAKSLALICYDPDVPANPENVNKEGVTIPADSPRVNFYHWVLVDIPTTLSEIPEGALSDSVTAGGKPVGKTDFGIQGANDYTKWFADDEKMGGTYGGYDGPCPPWNDERVHHYHFKLFALDVPTLGLSGAFSGESAMKAMEGHILAEAEWVGTYTLNPNLMAK